MDPSITCMHLSVTTKIGGGSIALFELMSRLVGVSETIISQVFIAPNDGVYFNKTKDLGVSSYEINLTRLSIRNLVMLRQIVKRHNVKLIHSHGKGAGIYSRLLKVLLKVKVVHTFHGFHYEHFSFFKRHMYLFLENILSHLTDKYIFVSHSEQTKFLNKINIGSEKSEVIYNGVENASSKTFIFRSNELRGSLCSADFLLICPTRVIRQKGVIEMVEILNLLIKNNNSVKLLIIGDVAPGESLSDDELLYKREVLLKIAEYKLETHVSILPKVLNPLDYFAIADIYLTTSLGEGFSLALIEAMSIGLPVVASRVTGNVDAIDNGVDGFLVEQASIAMYVSLIEDLIRNKEKRLAMGQNAKIKVAQKFNLQTQVQNYSEVYDEVLL
jgi:glycosyltransferase involved in cell wall biosynthesis